MKTVLILGSTGSIGESALQVVAALPDRFRVAGLAAQCNYRRALEQAAQCGARHVAIADPDAAERCAAAAPPHVRVWQGAQGLERMSAEIESDIVLCAVVGMAGLRPTLAALARGARVALATKETLVAAGHLVIEACLRGGGALLPVDSEHSAIFQCLPSGSRAERVRQVRRLVLTASGGPFARKKDVDFERIGVREALDHPNWAMGPKVTIDSATMMNKGLEIMEARWLFDIPVEKIEVLIHPESIVHSMVEFTDGSVLAQLSPPDMRFAIQYALTAPERLDGGLPALDLARIGTLSFEPPDERRFPCLALARRAAGTGGTMPTVLNASNEAAVARFLSHEIAFSDIPRMVEEVMGRHTLRAAPDLATIEEADRWARSETEALRGAR
jgi:1-deoxy-D-xylulose-5-phosphate reductoisomerase